MMVVPHPALGDYFDPGHVDVSQPYYFDPGDVDVLQPSYYGESWAQQSVQSASATAAQGVAAGAPLDVTLVQTGGAAASAAVGATAGASTAAIAVPVIGAVVAGVTFWLTRNRINNIRKEKATEVVNAAEAKMKENLKGYLSGPRTVSSQRQALANFDALWDYIVRGCTAIGGDPGKRCIEERKRGGSAPWCPTGTGCDYFTLYRDPIANDTPVPDGMDVRIDIDTGQVVTGSGSRIPLLALAAAGVGLWLMISGKED